MLLPPAAIQNSTKILISFVTLRMDILYKRKQKLKKLSHWINDVFRIGLNSYQRDTLNEYNNRINNTTNLSFDMYTEYKIKLLSLAVIAEYHDYQDATGERKKKIYTCYKNNGKVHNDLLVLIDYIVRYFNNHNQFINFILTTQTQLKQKNQKIMNYKEYFELKNQILRDVSYGMTSGINYSAGRLHTFIAQTYDRTDQETQRQLHIVLTELDQARRIHNELLERYRETH